MILFRKLLHSMIEPGRESKMVYGGFFNLLKHIPSGKNSLIDIGCGKGLKTLQYAAILNIPKDKIYGIDGNKEYVTIASDSLSASTLDIEKDKFPFEDKALDVVTCNQVFEHLKNFFFPLTEMERVLKIGGYMAIGIPNLAALHNRVLLLLGLQPICNHITGPHIRCFSHKAFVDFLNLNTNFKLIAVNGAFFYPFSSRIAERIARLFPSFAAYTFYLLRKEKHEPSTSAWNISSIGDTCL